MIWFHLCVMKFRNVAWLHCCSSLLVFIFCPSDALTQEGCSGVVGVAQNLYQMGQTSEAIVRLRSCLTDSIPAIERAQGYRLLALSLVAENYYSEADTAVRKMLELDEDIRPELNDPLKYIELVTAERKRRAHDIADRATGNKLWFYVAGGAITAGITAVLITIADSKPQAPRLPDPPVFPGD